LKTALKFCLLLLAAAVFSGCWSWQKTVSMGLWQSDEEKLQERAANEQEALMRKCEDADEISCNNLAVNFSALKNFNDAKIYYQKACDLGSNLGCLWTGYSYTEGKNGAEHDPKKDFEIFSKLCSSGYDDGCKFVAMGYRDGKGVEKNIDKAIEILSEIRDEIPKPSS